MMEINVVSNHQFLNKYSIMLLYIKETNHMFKDKLKELRIQKGISQYELADKLSVSRSAITKWENGNDIPSDVNFEAIYEFFDVEEE